MNIRNSCLHNTRICRKSIIIEREQFIRHFIEHKINVVVGLFVPVKEVF